MSHFHRVWPARLVMSCLLMLVMIVTATVLLSIGWVGTRDILLDSASRTARDAGQIVSERARRMIEPGAATLRILAFDPIVSAKALDDRLSRIGVFAEELSANPLVSAIYVAYSNGDFLLVRPLDSRELRQRFQAPAEANFLVQTVTQRADGSREGAFYYFDAENKLQMRRPMADYQFDPRVRPWYVAAKDTIDTVVSNPYVFFSTRQVGTSMSKLASNGDTIVGLDMALDDLAEGLSGLNITPGTELALLNADGLVIAYQDMSKVLVQQPNTDTIRFKNIKEMDVPALSSLEGSAQRGQAMTYHIEGKEWLGVSLPFDAIEGSNLHLLVAAPADELLGDLQRSRNRLILIAVGLIVFFLPFGWLAGNAMGKSMENIAERARRMMSFDFSRTQSPPPRLREVKTLGEVIDNVSNTIEAFLSISRVLGAEPRIETMLAQVLSKFMTATRCDAAAVYLLQQDSDSLLRAAECGTPDSFAETLAHRPSDSAQDAYWHEGRLMLQLRGRSRRLEGLLALRLPDDQEHAATEFMSFASRLSGMLAVAIETRQLIEAQKKLFNAVIRVLADAIDAKSPYTGGHCERVPELAMMLADKLTHENTGNYAAFSLNEEERYAFYLAAWLHDCGKVTSPEHIVDKATKLEVIYNRIHEVRMRFEVLWRDAELDCARAIALGDDALAAQASCLARQAQLQADFAFVAQCNQGGEFLSEQALARLQQIGSQTWLRHFDDSLGLSAEELQRLSRHRPAPAELPASEYVLADKPEHQVAWGERKPPVERGDPQNVYGFDMKLPANRQDLGELHNLGVRRGTLTDEDRFAINDHIVQTLIMLKKLPWPAHLERVPDIAANHHEKMDGTGYPRRIGAKQLQLTDRIMAIADIFEALTAADRPYKSAKSVSESLRIMALMGKDQHIDAQLFVYFLRSRIWFDYAQRFMSPAQLDEVDVEQLVQLAMPAAH
ncbi:HD domain-containing phosphohydrolase [Chitinibacter sp. GC72]|uniref:HD domain-containing phosphohydrolase n=1 Tax=Chitinibacter sp. GC72 TaxID=1526917 RepID=UPI0018DFA2F7|nr:HD domain-containing phosphohydrolase [Chitinibacter sp. GC72]